MRKMKLPNGYGGISKLSGNRRKPWRVRVTDGWEYNKEKGNMIQKFKIVGYCSNQKEARQALAEYNKHPYELTTKAMTFEEVYQVWSKKYFSTLKGDSSIRTITSAYSYCSDLYKMKIRDIRTYHLKDCMENHTPHETRHTFITLCKDAAVDDNLIKLIVGHKNKDITENIYTHRVLSELEEAIKKVPQYRIHTEGYLIDW